MHAQKNVPIIGHFFGSLLNHFLSKSCDSGLVIKSICYSFLHKQVMLADYVRRALAAEMAFMVMVKVEDIQE